MEAAQETLLDHIDNIKIPGQPFSAPTNEYWALICLWQGLEYLCLKTLETEQLVSSRVNTEKNVKKFIAGNSPEFEGVSLPLITNAFHWYSVSACQYVRTIGSIAYRQNPTRGNSRAYAESVIPEVLVFRDKVAAHFSWNTENTKDNMAERSVSVVPTLAFDDDRFVIGTWTLLMTCENKTSSSNAIKSWSLSRVHEQLRQRYWPNEHISK